MKAITSTGPDDWRAESDMRTLIDAQTIKNDPKRYAAAKKKAKEQAEGLESAFNIVEESKTK